MSGKGYLEPEDAWKNEGHWCEARSPYEAHQVCKEGEADSNKGGEHHIQAAHNCSHEPGLAGGPQLALCHECLHILKHWLRKYLQQRALVTQTTALCKAHIAGLGIDTCRTQVSIHVLAAGFADDGIDSLCTTSADMQTGS